jgi:hypothetical protein
VERPAAARPDAIPRGSHVGGGQRVPRGFDGVKLCKVKSRGIE